MTDNRPHLARPLFRTVITLAISALFLASFRLVPWPRPLWQSILITILPIPEVCILFGAGLLLGQRYHLRRVLIPLSLFLGLLIVWNAGELIYRWNYRDHFLLLDDLALLPSLLTMITGIPWFRTGFGGVITYVFTVFLLTLFGSVLVISAKRAEKSLRTSGLKLQRWGIVLLFIGLIQAVFLPLETPSILLVHSIISREVFPETATIPTSSFPAFTEEERQEAQRAFEAEEEQVNYAFPGIADGDVHLIIMESYGHTLFTNPVHRENIAPVYAESEKTLAEMGWEAASGFLDSPAYGGRSWLADSTLITGKRMSNQRIFDNHIYTGDPNLSGLMGAAGYHTIYAAPGTRRTPEDWKSYYNFDEYLIDGDMGWNGPSISFGEMSDQYFLDFVGRRFNDMVEPLFLTTILVSSHVPFVRIPEYFDDWNRLGDGTIYFDEGIRRFNNNWLTGSEYPEGYVYSIEYVMKTVLGYIDRYVDDNALVVVVGDHQPRTPISENTASSGVPIHFLSRSAERLKPLYSRGLSPGFMPEGTQEIIPMEEFPDMLNTVLRPSGILSRYMQ